MANPDLTKRDERKSIIEEIESEENFSRKRDAQRRFDCYKDRGDRYIYERLEKEFEQDSVASMRTITSINISKRVIDSLSSVYEREPEREFTNASDNEQAQIDALYEHSFFNTNMKISNRYFNLYDQGILYFIPMDGKICVKPLANMAFDVIPDENNPEKAYAYVLNTWDFGTHRSYREGNLETRYKLQDFVNQKIADDDDRKSKKRYIVWTDEMTFTMNGKGETIMEETENPIGELPFLDFAFEKDNQFFVRRGSDVTEFHLDMGVVLSDIATISRNQGYAQGVVISEKQPKVIKTNHDKWLWLPLNPDRPDLTPSMQFMSPNPDLAGSIDFAEKLVNMFLSSRGLDTSTVTTGDNSKTYSSGLERLLAMLDRFSASQDDFAMYRHVERRAFDKMRLWSNALQGVTGDLELIGDLKQATLNDDIDVSVQFKGPEQHQTDDERLTLVEREREAGLSSMKRAVMKYYNVGEEKALEILKEISDDERDLIGEIRENQNDQNGTQSDDQPA